MKRFSCSLAWQCLAVVVLSGSLGGGNPPQALGAEKPAEKPAEKQAAETNQQDWQPLFDGKSLEGWKITRFGGEGDVEVQEGAIVLGFGSSLTGITWQKEVPTSNYEIQLQAQRVDGTDFFCGLTFPVGSSHCSLIVGGWGGALVGLSSIDGLDASENDTQRIMAFENGRWYDIRLRVSDERIEAWIDNQQIISQPRESHQISIRPEVELSKPLGICTWDTKAALRRLRLRRLDQAKEQ